MKKQTERQIIFDKYEGHCAYCGCILEKGWHIDHLVPIRRDYRHDKAYIAHQGTPSQIFMPARKVSMGLLNPEMDIISNKMPACASCNINKHQMNLEEFRAQILGYMKHLNERNVQYKFAKKYALVRETMQVVKFWFEQFVSGECDVCKRESNMLIHSDWGDTNQCLKCIAIADTAELN